jgi:hypothetical protein
VKVQIYILMGLLIMALLISLGSCNTSDTTFATTPISHEDYNEEEVFLEAERLGLRPVDYLHYANNPNAIRPAFEIFGHIIREGTAREQLNALDEFQDHPCLTPPCNCGRGGNGWRGFKGRLNCLPFRGAREASDHQERLEAIVEIESVILGASTR